MKARGLGSGLQRKTAMRVDRLRMNPQSAPARMPGSTLAIWEEFGELATPQIVVGRLSDINAESALLTDNTPEIATTLQPIFKELRQAIGSKIYLYGLPSAAFAEIPEVAAVLDTLDESARFQILEELTPIIKLTPDDILGVDGVDNSDLAKQVRSLEGKLNTALNRQLKALEKDAELQQEKRALDLRVNQIFSFIPSLGWLKESGIRGGDRKLIRRYWSVVGKAEKSSAAAATIRQMVEDLQSELKPLKTDYEDTKQSSRRERRSLELDALNSLQFAHAQIFWDCLNILFFPGKGNGAFRIIDGKIALTLPNQRNKDLIASAAANLFLDATIAPTLLKQNAGIDKVLTFKVGQPPVNNIKRFQVSGFGLCGKTRAESTNERLDTLHAGILKDAEKRLGTDDFRVEICDHKNQRPRFGAKIGHMQNSRGSNDIEGAQVYIVDGLPKPSYGAIEDEYATFEASEATLEQFYQQRCDENIMQNSGRPRASRYPDKTFLQYWITEDQLPFEAEPIAAEKIAIEAGNKTEQVFKAIESFVRNWWSENGNFPTQKRIAEALGTTQGWISKVLAKFDGGWQMLKAIVAGLISPAMPPTRKDDVASADEAVVAFGLLPYFEDLQPEEVAEQINIIIKSFGWDGWNRIIRTAEKKTRITVLWALTTPRHATE